VAEDANRGQRHQYHGEPLDHRPEVVLPPVSTTTVICIVFVLIGHEILSVFHVSLPALKLAGGLILLLFALHLVLGEGEENSAGAGQSARSLDIASYPYGALDGLAAGLGRYRHLVGGCTRG
jgi:small neutral amino acid transporter SnatA (MarC family)